MLMWQAFAGVVAGHLAASFLQTTLHRVFGHGHAGQNLFGGRISSLHVDGHHSIYSGGRLVLPRYSDEDKSLSILYVLPAFLAIAPAFLLFPFAFATGFAAGMLLSYAIHIFMHAQYHLSDALFGEHEWFRKLRALHMVHHRRQNRNYAVIDLYWDKLMGTFAHPDAESESA